VHWNWVSTLGNAALILPLLACAAAVLATQSPAARRGAWLWLATAVAAIGLVAACKIAFYGWGVGVRAWQLASPSAHVLLAMAFWPVFLALLVPVQRPVPRGGAIVAGVALGVLCGWSRLATHAHSVSEVLAGAGIGAIAAGLALRAVRGLRLAIPRMAMAAALGMLILGWTRPTLKLPGERWLAQCGAYLAGREAPVSRADWLRTR